MLIEKSNVISIGKWKFTARREGKLLWVAEIESNLVVNVGLDELLSATLAGGAQSALWYLGLTSPSPTVAPTDTMVSHPGWTEVVAYSQASRQQWIPGAVSGQSVDNSASLAQVTINANGTGIGGAFLVNNNTKGGTTGILYAAGAFTAGDKTLDSNDTLDIQGTFTQQAA